MTIHLILKCGIFVNLGCNFQTAKAKLHASGSTALCRDHCHGQGPGHGHSTLLLHWPCLGYAMVIDDMLQFKTVSPIAMNGVY